MCELCRGYVVGGLWLPPLSNSHKDGESHGKEVAHETEPRDIGCSIGCLIYRLLDT